MNDNIEPLVPIPSGVEKKSYMMARRRYRAERTAMLKRYGLDSHGKVDEIIGALHFMCRDQPTNAELKAMMDIETELYMDRMAEREVGS